MNKDKSDRAKGNSFKRDYYFDSYSKYEIHQEMLQDSIRTNTYRKAILDNSKLFQDKIVLDVGCGSGILSLFAAQAGAKHVYGIEYAEIAEYAKRIVVENGYQSTITILRGKVEEIDLPVDKVDIIVSEWMGYSLLFESMLDTVIYARDKWLNEGGLILPDKATLYMSALNDIEGKQWKLDFWEDVEEFSMITCQDLSYMEPRIDYIRERQVVTTPYPILYIDLYTVKKEDLDFSGPFILQTAREDTISGFLLYFDCSFVHPRRPLVLSTSPFAPYTHWKQTIIYPRDNVKVDKNDILSGTVSINRNAKNPRNIEIRMEYQCDNRYGNNSYKVNNIIR